MSQSNIKTETLDKRKPTYGIKEYTPITINLQDSNLNIINREQQLCLCLSAHQEKKSTMWHPWYVTEGVDVVHTYCTTWISTTLEKSLVCVLILGPAPSLSYHPVSPVQQAGCWVHSAHVQQPWDPLPILSLKWLMVPKDVVSLEYKLNPKTGSINTKRREVKYSWSDTGSHIRLTERKMPVKMPLLFCLLRSSEPGPASDTFTKQVKLQPKAQEPTPLD